MASESSQQHFWQRNYGSILRGERCDMLDFEVGIMIYGEHDRTSQHPTPEEFPVYRKTTPPGKLTPEESPEMQMHE